MRSAHRVVARACVAAMLLLATQAVLASPVAAKANNPLSAATLALMRAKSMTPSSPVLVRVFKRESELEIWKQRADGRYALLKTFPICRWSGRLGPKRATGDRQAPEGFYEVTPRLMNPNSSYHLSFDTGFPNAYDKAHGYTGSFLMVHGACSSMGCYAMTDNGVEEIYGLLREAFRGGQKAVQLQAYPFRMTARNLARMRDDEHIAFWRQLKAGYDRFEATGLPPVVKITGRRYDFAPYRAADMEAKAQARLRDEMQAIQQQVDEGAPSVRVTYADGGMHPVFARMRDKSALGVISRPEALAFAGRDVIVRPGVRKPQPVMVASAVSVTFAMWWEAAQRQAIQDAPLPSPALPVAIAPPRGPTSPVARIALAHDGARDAFASLLREASPAQARDSAWTRLVVAMAATSSP